MVLAGDVKGVAVLGWDSKAGTGGVAVGEVTDVFLAGARGGLKVAPLGAVPGGFADASLVSDTVDGAAEDGSACRDRAQKEFVSKAGVDAGPTPSPKPPPCNLAATPVASASGWFCPRTLQSPHLLALTES